LLSLADGKGAIHDLRFTSPDRTDRADRADRDDRRRPPVRRYSDTDSGSGSG
jgi:hypothetical protein